MKKENLSPKQKEVLDTIILLAKKGYPPSLREIAEATGTPHTNSIRGRIAILVRKGYLAERPRRFPRALRVL
jgi:repressor LexA